MSEFESQNQAFVPEEGMYDRPRPRISPETTQLVSAIARSDAMLATLLSLALPETTTTSMYDLRSKMINRQLPETGWQPTPQSIAEWVDGLKAINVRNAQGQEVPLMKDDRTLTPEGELWILRFGVILGEFAKDTTFSLPDLLGLNSAVRISLFETITYDPERRAFSIAELNEDLPAEVKGHKTKLATHFSTLEREGLITQTKRDLRGGQTFTGYTITQKGKMTKPHTVSKDPIREQYRQEMLKIWDSTGGQYLTVQQVYDLLPTSLKGASYESVKSNMQKVQRNLEMHGYIIPQWRTQGAKNPEYSSIVPLSDARHDMENFVQRLLYLQYLPPSEAYEGEINDLRTRARALLDDPAVMSLFFDRSKYKNAADKEVLMQRMHQIMQSGSNVSMHTLGQELHIGSLFLRNLLKTSAILGYTMNLEPINPEERDAAIISIARILLAKGSLTNEQISNELDVLPRFTQFLLESMLKEKQVQSFTSDKETVWKLAMDALIPSYPILIPDLLNEAENLGTSSAVAAREKAATPEGAILFGITHTKSEWVEVPGRQGQLMEQKHLDASQIFAADSFEQMVILMQLHRDRLGLTDTQFADLLRSVREGTLFQTPLYRRSLSGGFEFFTLNTRSDFSMHASVNATGKPVVLAVTGKPLSTSQYIQDAIALALKTG